MPRTSPKIKDFLSPTDCVFVRSVRLTPLQSQCEENTKHGLMWFQTRDSTLCDTFDRVLPNTHDCVSFRSVPLHTHL